MNDRILTLHPEPGKSGVNIDRKEYDLVRQAIVESIRARGEITFKALAENVGHRLAGRFDLGSIYLIRGESYGV